MNCKNPQIVKFKLPAFGTVVQVHYKVPCWRCEECLKVKNSMHFSKKEVKNAKTQKKQTH